MLVWTGLLQRTLVLGQFLMGWLASSYLKNYDFYKKKMLKHAYVYDAVDMKDKWLDRVRGFSLSRLYLQRKQGHPV